MADGMDIGDRTSTAVQLLLFETEPTDPTGRKRLTNAVGLYDLAPRFVYASGDSTEVRPAGSKDYRSVKREFEFDGKLYNLTLMPALVEKRVTAEGAVEEGADGKPKRMEVVAFPGDREQIVEEVVRRLATDRARLALDDGDNVQLRFSLHEIKRELKRVKHTLSNREIKEALLILSRATIVIERKGKNGGALLNSSAFPVLAIKGPGVAMDESADDSDADNDVTYLQFNPLVAQAIRKLDFRSLSYEMLMRLKNPISRWLYKRLSLTYADPSGVSPITISAKDVVANSGMNEWSRWRDTLRAVSDAVDLLAKEGVVSAEKEPLMDGRKYVDIVFRLYPTESFLEQMRAAGRLTEENFKSFRELTKGGAPSDGFVRVDDETAAVARRQRRLAAERQGMLAAPGRRAAG